ncbi:MAG: hypothetical protein M1814_000856 [Vezdaea aestivalis]|nr:MAG: hypothetical protein M1814_000856 [Vezdaea aestivalis]
MASGCLVVATAFTFNLLQHVVPICLTEEQVIEIFSTVGQVISFRLVHDRDTHRPKGFGFAEFADPEIASSAVRNLDNYEVMNRKLRVDFSKEGGDDEANNSSNIPPPTNGTSLPTHPPPPSSSSAILPPLPPGTDLPPGVSAPDAISRTLNTLKPIQLLDILSQMKGLVTADAAKATELLRQAPQLSYAIFQALLLMGLVDASALQEVVETAAQQGGGGPVQGAPQPPPLGAGMMPPYPGQGGPPPIPPPHHQPAHTPQQGAYGGYQPPAPLAPPALPLGGIDQNALIQQVLSLTPDQVEALNEPEKSQIQALRQQYMGGGQRMY